jgi:muramidase (phage lysozyme)
MASKDLAQETKNTLDLIKQGLSNPAPWLTNNVVAADNTRVANYVAAFNTSKIVPINPNKTVNFGKITVDIPNSYKALLDMIAVTEGTAGASQEYDILVGGKTLTGWNSNYTGDHPRISINIPGIGNTNAAGRYQFLDSTKNNVWTVYGKNKGLKFNKNGQDTAGYYLLIEKRNVNKVLANEAYDIAKTQPQVAGNPSFLKILDKIAAEWASIPQSNGRAYYGNQPARFTPQSVYSYYLQAVNLYK